MENFTAKKKKTVANWGDAALGCEPKVCSTDTRGAVFRGKFLLGPHTCPCHEGCRVPTPVCAMKGAGSPHLSVT